jgi:uncharacterized membrane protein YdjX (TVP38/TMEM64 family)
MNHDALTNALGIIAAAVAIYYACKYIYGRIVDARVKRAAATMAGRRKDGGKNLPK